MKPIILTAVGVLNTTKPETGKCSLDELASVDALLLGRITYDLFAAYWPNQTGGGFATVSTSYRNTSSSDT